MGLVLRGATFSDGTVGDVRCEDGLVSAIGDNVALPHDDVIECTGRLLTTAFCEPHAHLDKAFLAEIVDNPTGDLIGAIRAMQANRHLFTIEGTAERAERAVRLLSRNGVTALRTHVDVTLQNGLVSVHALTQVRERTKHLVDMQIVALSGQGIVGPDAAVVRSLLLEALAAGADLVGGCPHLEPDARLATDTLLSIASDAECAVDLHTDETLDPSAQGLRLLAEHVLATGFKRSVTASHCCSLSTQHVDAQRATAEVVAEAGISVIALPQTNLYLQGRDHAVAKPRGLAPVDVLTAAGVNVAAGADNLQDPFNLIGRGDPLEVAALMVAAAHVLPSEAYRMVTSRARHALGVAPADVQVGAAAEFVVIPSRNPREAIAFQPDDRTVIRAGAVVHAER